MAGVTASDPIVADGSVNRPDQTPAPPSISLPKGGGAIRGLGEKFAVSPSTGTASMSLPIPVSAARDGMQPNLRLAYDSGAGNSAFGLGWSVSPGMIARKTDHGLPRYVEGDPVDGNSVDGDSGADVYVLSGSEDLVPVLDETAGWTRQPKSRTLPDGSTWQVERFRPRIEQSYARIERWTPATGEAAHWRTITASGMVTRYGIDDESRIADPADPARVFSWLISESWDVKGNAMRFDYVAEDSVGVDTTQAHERNRTDASRSANRYLKGVRYGNATPRVDGEDLRTRTNWLFEVVCDYGDHDDAAPSAAPEGPWPVRADPFSTYRAGFEVRTYRLCQRLLVFHHFPDEPDVGADCLVRSLRLGYQSDPVATMLTSVTMSGHRRDGDGYATRSLPPLELGYSAPPLHTDVIAVDATNLPEGVGGPFALVDLDGDGLPGIVSQQPDAWFYRRNVSPMSAAAADLSHWSAAFAPLDIVADHPTVDGAGIQFIDVVGDGRLAIARMSEPLAGFQARADDGTWAPFRPFASMPQIAWTDPDTRMTDLTGDGLPDILITRDDSVRWYASLGEEGFGAGADVPTPHDEERGPRLVFADPEMSIYLADMSGDAMADLVRVRNDEICYWPNLGYGRFGAKITMDGVPRLANADVFDHRRVRLADVDGSGPADLVYLGANGVAIYPNTAGNGFGPGFRVDTLAELSDPGSIVVADLLGTGTACLVWSSSLPGDERSPLRYVDLLGGTKPRLLTSLANNFGAETVIGYTSSTGFSVRDRVAGRPWVTPLPFPIQVVARVETYDRIGRNRFTSRYAYHHGYFDGFEREFRGFAMVEQWDTEEFGTLTIDGTLPDENLDDSSHLPPVLTRTWFHTGAFIDADRISTALAGEYYREGTGGDGLAPISDAQSDAIRLPDSTLPVDVLRVDGTRVAYGLTAPETREACRALKGSMLRQETYGLDGSDAAARPYQVAERTYGVELLQPQAANEHAVFLPHARESVEIGYERTARTVTGGAGDVLVADPRITHSFTFDVDAYGNVGSSAAIGYGRRHPDDAPELTDADRTVQATTLASYSTYAYTNAIDADDAVLNPLSYESNTYELRHVTPDVEGGLFRFAELLGKIGAAADGGHDLALTDVDGSGATGPEPYRRLLQRGRALYRSDDLSTVLPLGTIESLGWECESYHLAYTQGLLDQIFVSPDGDGLIADPAATLGGDGGYVRGGELVASGLFPTGDPADDWWVPSGRQLLSPGLTDSAATELAFARDHFFQPCRFRAPFGQQAVLARDRYDLLTVSTTDPLGNQVTADLDYRVLAPTIVTDVNGNRTACRYDILGSITATAVMGKPGQSAGDSLAGVVADIDDATMQAHLADPLTDPRALLGTASTRTVYDVGAYYRTRADTQPQPTVAYALTRETHEADLAGGAQTIVRHAFAYSDGFSRVIQHKSQATPAAGAPRWVGSSWVILDNKGNVVREFEPFFTVTHAFEFAVTAGVGLVRLFDCESRPVAVLHQNHTFDKSVVTSWRTDSWDVNDTVLVADPAADPDIGRWISRLPPTDYLPTWHDQRSSGGLGADEQAAATATEVHAATPGSGWVDARGRQIVSAIRNRYIDGGGATVDETNVSRSVHDIQGNVREVVDARGRVCGRSAYDAVGRLVRAESIDAGTRWSLCDVRGNTIRTWDSLGRQMATGYDELRRPVSVTLTNADGTSAVVQRLVYGESQPDPETDNLRGRVVEAYDGAGRLASGPYDFKGNLLRTVRTLTTGYREVPDWSGSVPLGEELSSETTFDALNRPLTRTTPDGASMTIKYDETGQLATMTGSGTGAMVTSVEHNEKGQRTSITYGNGVSTSYTYDPLTFRLSTSVASGGVQDLSFTYDPVGNVMSVRDDAQPTIFFHGTVVEARCDYVYDAEYRLVEATGREHLGQALAPVPTSATDAPRIGLPAPGDFAAMGRYRERITYDPVGNIAALVHQGDSSAQPGWRRDFTYAEPGALDPNVDGDRLSSFAEGGGPAQPFTYDAHGNVRSMPSLPSAVWDYADRLQATSRQVVNAGTPETTYYVYDAGGGRVRKVTERQAADGATPTLRSERVYCGAFEVYREYDGTGTTVTLERQTLSAGDGGLLVLAETRTQGTDPGPASLIRYQLTGRLGSALVELDDAGALISYEEYYPYGGTSYQAVRSQTETPKRYRWAGRERDEESGLYYGGARYYASWLGRWISPDPAGMVDGPNLYAYVRGNPITRADPSGRATNGTDDPAASSVRITATPKSAFSATPRPPAMTYQQARDAANDATHNYRAANNMHGGTVQVGHSAAAEEAPNSGITAAEMNNPETFIRVHSRVDPKLYGTVTNQQGQVQGPKGRNTLHNVQEEINQQSADGVRAANNNVLTPDGHVEASHEVVFKTENTPLDQQNIDYVRAGGRASNPGPLVNEHGQVVEGPLPEPPTLPAKSAGPPPQLHAPLPEVSLPTEPVVPTVQLPIAEVPSAKPPVSGINWAEVGSNVVEGGEALMRGVAAVLTVYGATNESIKTYDQEQKLGRGTANAVAGAGVTSVVTVLAGVVDDALTAATIEIGAAPVMESWSQNDAGPAQHAGGEMIRSAIFWGNSHGM